MTNKSTVRASRGRRWLRGGLWALGVLLLALALVVGAVWWWAGSATSLATAVDRLSRALPAGQSLQAEGVEGSIRHGGRIGVLRWQDDALEVEAHGVSVGWQLIPLLVRRMARGEVAMDRLRIARRGPQDDAALKPPESLTLPVAVDIPFRIARVEWDGPPPLVAEALAGRYRYDHSAHRLEVTRIDIADGRYYGDIRLQASAPMELAATLGGTVRTPAVGKVPAQQWHAQLQANGPLAQATDRIQLQAALRPVEDAQPMRASGTATVAPYAAQPVVAAQIDVAALNLAVLWPGAPRTAIAGRVDVTPGAAADQWSLGAALRNAAAGPWDRGALPVATADVRAVWQNGALDISEAVATLGKGSVRAEGRWAPSSDTQPAGPWQLRATVRELSPAALHTQLDAAAISGTAQAQQQGDHIAFTVGLGTGASGAARPGALLRLDRVDAEGRWKAGALFLRRLRIATDQASVEGTLDVNLRTRSGEGTLSASAPGATARIDGDIAPTAGSGSATLAVTDAARLQRWAVRVPGLADALAGSTVAGSATVEARWQGGWRQAQQQWQGQPSPFTLQATATAPQLDATLAQPNAVPTTVTVRNLRAEASGSLADAALSLSGEASSGGQRLAVQTRLRGGMVGAHGWRAAVASLRLEAQDDTLPGPWRLQATAPFDLTYAAAAGGAGWSVDASVGSATLTGPLPGTARIGWQPLRYQRTAGDPPAHRLRSQGRVQGIPMAWAEAMAEGGRDAMARLGVAGDLVFDGDWDIDAADQLRARVSLARASGDIRVQTGGAGDAPAPVTRVTSSGTGTGSGGAAATVRAEAPTTQAGNRTAALTLEAEGDAVRARLAWDSERAGNVQATLSTRVVQQSGGWAWPADAPLAGTVRARLPNVGAWSVLAPPGWRVQGTLEADATLAGSRTAPRWTGTLAADGLSVRSVVDGIELTGGRLRATLRGDRIDITEFRLQGGTGGATRISGMAGSRATAREVAAPTDGGSLSGTGSIRWSDGATAGASGIRMDIEAEARALRLLVRSDRQITVSGTLQARLEGGLFTLRGRVTTDRAVFILPDETAPSLGSDVVVRSAASDREAAARAERAGVSVARAQTRRPPDIAITFDLGRDFAVQGRGITTRLEGVLDIRSTQGLATPPRVTGDVRTVRGQYRAYGQQLDVESGLARFNGPFDNPSLDILAVRPNIPVRAGVQVTGTAQAPRVRLYSEPDMPDVEKLSWVVLGRSTANGGAEAAVLQQAALALLSGRGRPGGGSFANRLGLDEIGFKGPGTGDDASGSALTFGKRLTQDLYVTYERSLSGTLGTLFIFYDLTRRLTLRGQAGEKSGVDLIYTVRYE